MCGLALLRLGYHTEVVTDGVREASQSHAFGSPVPGEGRTPERPGQTKKCPRRMAVVFDHVDGMPAEIVDVVDDLALELVLWRLSLIGGHALPHSSMADATLSPGWNPVCHSWPAGRWEKGVGVWRYDERSRGAVGPIALLNQK
jgi:hypothetical protein